MMKGVEEIPSLKLFTATWNMGESEPPKDISPFIIKGYDMYVIGVQECEYVPRSTYGSVEEDW